FGRRSHTSPKSFRRLSESTPRCLGPEAGIPYPIENPNNFEKSQFVLDMFCKSEYMGDVPCQSEGRFAIVSIRGMRDAMDAASVRWIILLDEIAAAYGKVVWSWRRDRGVHPPRRCGVGNGDKKRRSPGRARRKPSNHCAGKAGVTG